jgi:hypothetical protein
MTAPVTVVQLAVFDLVSERSEGSGLALHPEHREELRKILLAAHRRTPDRGDSTVPTIVPETPNSGSRANAAHSRIGRRSWFELLGAVYGQLTPTCAASVWGRGCQIIGVEPLSLA